MDDLDRKIITATQSGLPLVKNPYEIIAKTLNIEVTLLKQRMNNMLENGQIRRIGAVPNHYKLGYTANAMSVWDVSDDKINELGQQLGALSFVSHCYERPRFLPEWPYNLFAMVHGKNKEEVMQQIQQIVTLLGKDCSAYELLYSKQILKKTGLRLKDKNT
ncbi:MAG: Lrp/AsnC family transcriptional regulator [gamma proteobacterium symbiont of Taylorina sp.]|nr:Lrp/AsnC family transcriptional regulator [gamma proteobacterium symbiont of Taylorina sp.]